MRKVTPVNKYYLASIPLFLTFILLLSILLTACQEASAPTVGNSAGSTVMPSVMGDSSAVSESGKKTNEVSNETDQLNLENGWSELKNLVFDYAGDKKLNVRMFGSNADGNKEIRAVLEYGNKSMTLGTISVYGIDDVNVLMVDLTNDGINELVVQGPMGATSSPVKVLGYDSKNDSWKELLNADNILWDDLDRDGSSEIISRSQGSLPPSVLIYSWKGNHFDMLDAAAATGNDYAILKNLNNGYYCIEAGKIKAGTKQATKLYAYRDGKLIEHSQAFKESEERILPESSSRLLTGKDLEGLAVYTLDLARNEIFARHGYIFSNEQYRSYFSNKSWYSPNEAYQENLLNDIEKKNANFLKQLANKYSANFRIVEGNSISADLNGDGKNEEIRLECTPGSDSYTLFVNGSPFMGNGNNLDGKMYLCDIDSSDKYREIAITESGPSSDEATYFFCYDGRNIHFMGRISGSQYVIGIAGNGKVLTRTRGDILQTWFYPDYYRLSASHELENIPQKLYRMDTMVTVRKQLKLQRSPSDAKVAVTLEPWEDVKITRCDNKQWCEVENSKGEIGWFAVERFDMIRGTGLSASEFFNGLCYAD